MNQLQRLREQRAQAVAEMRAILDGAAAEDRDLTAEEATKYDELKAGVDRLGSQITRLEEQEELEAQLDAPSPAAARGQRPVTQAPGAPARTEFESLGEFLHAVRFNPNDQRLSYHEFDGARAEQRLDTGEAGGFAVPHQFRNDLLRVTPQAAAFRPRATVIPAGSPPDASITITALDQTGTTPSNVYGGVTVNWIAEGGQKPESDARLREIKVEPQEVAGFITVTDKLLRNWPAASGFLEQQLRGAMVSAEEHSFLTGNGVGKPLGLVNAAAAYVVNREVSGQFVYEDAAAMIARLLMRGAAPIWMLSQSVMPQLLTMRNTIGSPAVGDGALVWQPSAREGEPDRLFGRPIFWHERSPQLGVKGDVVLSDISSYLIKDGSGPFVAASPHVRFTENKTVIKAFWNVDGQPWLTAPFTQEGGYQVSPFVVLDVPAA